MKKLFSIVTTIIMILTLAVPASAVEFIQETDTAIQSLEKLSTTEDDVPAIIATKGSVEDTLVYEPRSTWVEETSVILEDAYSQEIKSVNEDQDYIIFEFAPPEHIARNVSYIDRVEYVKPESQLSTSSYSRKITYMYGWGDGYYPIQQESGTWDTVKNILISAAGFNNKITIAQFILSFAPLYKPEDLGPGDPIDATCTAQYYYQNKVGQIKNPETGTWEEQVYVGSQRTFYRTIVEREDEYGRWETIGFHEASDEEIGDPANPSGYDKIEFKAHFQDNSWILDQAETIFAAHLMPYIDVFAVPPYTSETIPSS